MSDALGLIVLGIQLATFVFLVVVAANLARVNRNLEWLLRRRQAPMPEEKRKDAPPAAR